MCCRVLVALSQVKCGCNDVLSARDNGTDWYLIDRSCKARLLESKSHEVMMLGIGHATPSKNESAWRH